MQIRFLPLLLTAFLLGMPPDAAMAQAAVAPPSGTARALDTAFDKLKNATAREQARRIEREIWTLWMQSGNDEVDALMLQALELSNLRQFEASLRILDAVVIKAPKFAEGWNRRATVLYLIGDYKRSLSDIERVLELEPRHFGAISGIALISLAQGNKKAALDAFRRVVRIHPFSRGVKQAIESLAREVEGKKI
jgi:tetratricopeptide (TPR) repeat protein